MRSFFLEGEHVTKHWWLRSWIIIKLISDALFSLEWNVVWPVWCILWYSEWLELLRVKAKESTAELKVAKCNKSIWKLQFLEESTLQCVCAQAISSFFSLTILKVLLWWLWGIAVLHCPLPLRSHLSIEIRQVCLCQITKYGRVKSGHSKALNRCQAAIFRIASTFIFILLSLFSSLNMCVH